MWLAGNAVKMETDITNVPVTYICKVRKNVRRVVISRLELKFNLNS